MRSMQTIKAAVSVAALVGAALLPSVASAQDKDDCPPGSWFCDGEKSAQGSQKELEPLPSADPKKADAKEAGKEAAKSDPPVVYQPAAPPVVVYQPPPPVMVVQPRDAPPPYVYVPRRQKRREWGLNVHLLGGMLGRGASPDAGMGGLGFGLRYKPIPGVGLQGDLDFVGGRDYYGKRRSETAFTLNALFFLNPKDKFQVYLLTGFGWAGARVVDDRQGYDAAYDSYAYFGGQAGFGAEWRVSRHFGLNADLRGFVRGRIDPDAAFTAEFRDGSGRATNTSGGGVFQAGMTFYF
jgi:hypothetical protein